MKTIATSIILALSSTVGVRSVCAQQELTSPADVVDAFHAAVAGGDSSGALSLLLPDVTIFESGGAEMSRDEFASHHLGADMKFAAATTREVTSRQSNQSGDFAWVLSKTQTSGTYGERSINSVGVETMLLKRADQGWRIRHIHWSSRRQH
ncbi:MAG: YybH family protein [Gemmatimonadales bacterium]